MNILCIGDVVGDAGRGFLAKKLPEYKRLAAVDICVVNGENSAQGNGITEQSAGELFSAGADAVTTGNHVFRRREVYDYLDRDEAVLRPYNYPAGAPGHGVYIIDRGRYRVGVINLLGTVFSEPLANPFESVLSALKELEGIKHIIVDFHAEATSEKKAMGFFLDGRVTALTGTHTHVQTADETVLENGTAYITDIGMTGPIRSVLGIKPELVIEKLRTSMPVRFENSDGACMMNGCLIHSDDATGRAISVERVNII